MIQPYFPSKPQDSTAPSPQPPLCWPAWARLQALADAGIPHLRQLLAESTRHTLVAEAPECGIRLDHSRQAYTDAVLHQLLALAEQADIPARREAMFRGEVINTSEQRAVLHVALRGAPHARGPEEAPWGEAVQGQVQAELARVLAFARAVRAGEVRGSSGLPFSDVVNIGIGGSDLGPRMATLALEAHTAGHGGGGPRVHYLSNPDAWALHRTLAPLDPHRTLFIVASKTFTTQETLTNAASARRWLADAGITGPAQSAHLVAITAAPERSAQAGYLSERTFTFWDWVGGRYSVWSALGLPLALAIGPEAFADFLAGGRAMDHHFRTAPLASNLPVLLALAGIWNRNFLHCPTQLLSAYASRLALFAPFIQQMDMESNGKRVQQNGQPCPVPTGPIVWGGLGIDGQHAYFQLLHQGMHRVPVEFIGVLSEDTPIPLAAEHHRVVTLNLRAQAQALALGRDAEATLAALEAEGLSPAAAQALVSQRSFAGNVPSSLIWLDRLSPHRLGALVALYEHKVFVQAAIWGINAYDQWGVELGKTMAKALEATPA